MLIDNVGYDVAAMVKLTQKEFIEEHLPNDAIGKGLTGAERVNYLKKVYSQLKATPPDEKGVAK